MTSSKYGSNDPSDFSESFKKLIELMTFDGFGDSQKFKKEYLPKVLKYRENLENALPQEYKIKLPKSQDELVEDRFNAIKFLYDEKLLSNREFEITDSSASTLVQLIAEGKLTAVETFKAFAKRATICHQFTNCAMMVFIDEGLKRAEYLDEYYKKNGTTIGPLHGLPVSLKEHLGYKNKITHGSFAYFMDTVPEEHGTTTQILENLGAVFYIRTNEPQCMLHIDSNNPITGQTRNPHNMSLSPGGSSSGEGALVSFGGSPLGVGSDIGGSIRVPAAFCGCYGFRPTTRRISTAKDYPAGGGGAESLLHVCGPLARSIEDLELFMKCYINEGKPWMSDQWSLPIPWRSVPKPAPKDVTIAIMYDNGLVKPTPPIQRGLHYMCDKLKAAGFNIVTFKPIEPEAFWKCILKLYKFNDNNGIAELLKDSGEPLMKLTRWSLLKNSGKMELEPDIAIDRESTTAEIHKYVSIRDELRQKYTMHLIENKIDFILGPVYNNVAGTSETPCDTTYSGLYNLLDFPSLTIQTGLSQDPKIDIWEDSHKQYKCRNVLEEYELGNYKPENFESAPIALQLAGRRYFDEEVIACGKLISEVLGVNPRLARE